MNYVLLDEKSFKAVQSGFVAVLQITGSTQKQLLQLASDADISITHNGYLYVWVSNESKGNVYFDDIYISYQQGALLEENHFYPYGLKMAALSSKAFFFTAMSLPRDIAALHVHQATNNDYLPSGI